MYLACSDCNESLDPDVPHVCDIDKLKSLLAAERQSHIAANDNARRIHDSVFSLLAGAIKSLGADGDSWNVDSATLSKLYDVVRDLDDPVSVDLFIGRWSSMHLVLTAALRVFNDRNCDRMIADDLGILREQCIKATEVFGYSASKLHDTQWVRDRLLETVTTP